MDSAGSELKGGSEIDLGKMNLYGFFNTDGVEDLPLSDDDESEEESNAEVADKYDVAEKYAEESDDESDFGGGPVWNLFSNAAVYREVYHCAVYALKQYNAEEDKNYKFDKIVKANLYPVAGVVYFITFQAKDQGLENVGPAGGPIVEFEAEVFLGLPDKQNKCKMDVHNFRRKGSEGTRGIKGCCGCGYGSGSGTSSE